jgi:hypothetical protein
MLFDPQTDAVPIRERLDYLERTKVWREDIARRMTAQDFAKSPSLERLIREVEAKLSQLSQVRS